MRLKIDTMQKRVGLLIFTVGTYALVMNISQYLYDGSTLIHALVRREVLADSLFLLPGFLSIFFENRVMKLFQVLTISLLGAANIFTSYNEVYGPSLFFLGWLLARQYGYFIRHKKIKYYLLVTFFVIVVQLSAYKNGKHVFILNNELLEFSVFLIIFTLVIWKDILDRDESLFKENKRLRSDYTMLRKRVDTIENDKKPYNLKAAKISPAEERVLRVLVKYKASNKEIAERLNISESTVKLHLYNIFNKLGADNRFSVIDLCQYNFDSH